MKELNSMLIIPLLMIILTVIVAIMFMINEFNSDKACEEIGYEGASFKGILRSGPSYCFGENESVEVIFKCGVKKCEVFKVK